MRKPGLLILSLLLCFTAAFLGTLFTTPAIPTWYADLQKPFFNPPNEIFGPVWTLLYTLMAIALYLVWRKGEKTTPARKVFFIQLGLNVLWSAAFFGLHNPLFGLIVIFALWIAIKKTIDAFLPLSRPAGYLLYPYLAWVSFATILNFAIAVLNF